MPKIVERPPLPAEVAQRRRDRAAGRPNVPADNAKVSLVLGDGGTELCAFDSGRADAAAIRDSAGANEDAILGALTSRQRTEFLARQRAQRIAQGGPAS